MLKGESSGEEFGDYTIYKFMVGIDIYYATLLSKSAKIPSLTGDVSGAGAEKPISFVGPGCPQYFTEIANGYAGDSTKQERGGGVTYASGARKRFEPFLEEAASALDSMPLYGWLRGRHLIPVV